jgi:K+-transporting ATPase ATPase B chain
MDRLVQRNVLAMSGRAVEAAGDCTTLLLDKTGTITFGRAGVRVDRRARRRRSRLAEAALASSLADETPRVARSSTLAVEQFGLAARPTGRDDGAVHRADPHVGMDYPDGRSVRKGAADSVRRLVDEAADGADRAAPIVEQVSRTARPRSS